MTVLGLGGVGGPLTLDKVNLTDFVTSVLRGPIHIAFR